MNLPAGHALIPAGGEVRLLAGVLLRGQQVRMPIERQMLCHDRACVSARPDRMARYRLDQGEQEGSEPAGANRQGSRNIAGLAR